MNRIKRELSIEDIDGVYEDGNGAPVVRVASLVDGGLYFARPTEVRVFTWYEVPMSLKERMLPLTLALVG